MIKDRQIREAIEETIFKAKSIGMYIDHRLKPTRKNYDRFNKLLKDSLSSAVDVDYDFDRDPVFYIKYNQEINYGELVGKIFRLRI